ncbi:MAG: peptidoglycan-binding domain-containing protein [Bacteroidota bacterium]
MITLSLGNCDVGKIPQSKNEFLKPYHWVGGVFKDHVSFRNDDRSKWCFFREKAHNGEVKELQTFLFNAGFMPRASKDGIFGYVTESSVRLFQEYVRTIEGVKSMKPDGIVGSGTWGHIRRWQQNNIVSEWGQSSATNASPEFNKWITLLNKVKTHYQQNPSPIINQVNRFAPQSQTLKLDDWKFDPEDIHLIGIRKGQFDYNKDQGNHDIFLLLIRGMVFKFWGSTVPNQKHADRNDVPFLVEGQHQYRFGWHKISEEKKVYRALKPYPKGVIVLRYDLDGDNTLATDRESDRLDTEPNHSINIHWSGKGNSSWSAGCMVIASGSYINHRDQKVDCSKFAAINYNDLNDTVKKTKGAYNVFTDLILAYAPKGVDHLYFTLGRDSTLKLDASLGQGYRENILTKIK